MKVIPAHTFHTCPPLDILVVPGGWGTRRELKNPVMLDWLKARAAQVETLTSVCTGSMLLGLCRSARRPARHDPLEVARLDAGFVPVRDGGV